MSAPALRLRGVRAGYARGPDVLAGLDLDVEAGRTLAVLGPSGGGKSTLLKVAAGLLPVRAGSAQVFGHDARRRVAGEVGYIPQRLGLVRHASALDNAAQGGLHRTPMWRSLARRPAPAVLRAARDALALVGLAGAEDQPVHALSGGQQRRVATARALVQTPRLLLADEFLGELDPATVDVVIAAVQRLGRDHGTTLILVEHHLDQAERLADRVLTLDAGRATDLTAVTA